MNRIPLILVTSFIWLGTALHAQMTDLEYLSSLVDQNQKNQSQSFNETEYPSENIKTEKLEDPDRYKDENYGFTVNDSYESPPKRKTLEDPLEYFGYSFFTEPPETFSSLDETPIPPDYLIGPNDNIKIILYGDTNFSYDLKVTRDGDIFLPGIGPLNVAGITFSDLQALIDATVETQLIGTKASVTLGKLRAINIFILGEAKQPGMYSISALSTLTNAIIKSGGVKTSGTLRDIQLKRNGETIASFDFYNLLLQGDTSKDMRLMQGDVIFIPPIQKTSGISGEVLRPGIYELKTTDRLDDLINFAGGLKPKANIQAAEIKRINTNENNFQMLSLDLSKNTELNMQLYDGDIISIYPVIDALQRSILVSGHAMQPGFYPWSPGMKITDIFGSVDYLLANTDLSYGLVKRRVADTQSSEFIQFDLGEVFKNNGSDENIDLQENDEIILLPSLIDSDLITTRYIQNTQTLDDELNPIILEGERTSSSFLRKSIIDMNHYGQSLESLGALKSVELSAEESNEDKDVIYYEYHVYDYCMVPTEMLGKLVDRITISAIDIDVSFDEASENDFSNELTKECRSQLLAPLLRQIKMQSTDSNKNQTVTIFGNVHYAGEYPLSKNMNLADVIKAAGGYKSSTYDLEIEIIRSDKSEKDIKFKNTYTSLDRAKSFSMQASDVVNLKQLEDNITTVEIRGEVYFPGIYPTHEDETLSQLIKRAGGIKKTASLSAARFQRESLKRNDIEQIQNAQQELTRKALLSSQTNTLGQEDFEQSEIVNLTNALATSDFDENDLGRLVIDLEGILSRKVKDIVLEDKDAIFIPKERQTISVFGEVYVRNTHIYDSQITISEYIELSGGATEFADTSNIYIIKASGGITPASSISNGFFRENSNLQPGDTIVVPINIKPFSAIRATTEVSQILYQMALAAAAVNSF